MDSLRKANEEGIILHDILIAKGMYPIPKIPSYVGLLLNPKKYVLAMNKILENQENKNKDYKNLSSICILPKGTPVAKKYDTVGGKNGLNIEGKMIPYQTVITEEIIIGKNLLFDEDNDIVTTIDGEFVYEDNEILVNDVLVLTEGVNYNTGHIRFSGSIVIKGEVEDNFNIYVEKNIYSKNTIRASEIICGGNLIVSNGGIFGRNQKKIVVNHNVEAVHLESVFIEATDGIYIEKCSFNSNLFTNGEIVFGSSSKLVGGVVHSKNGLNVRDIGSTAGTRTKIICGLDFIALNKILLLKKYRDKLVTERKKVGNSNRVELLKDIDCQILKCNLSMEYIVNNVKYNEKARIYVRGTIFPGTSLEICHIHFEVTSPLSNGFFYLNKGSGKVEFRRTKE